MVDYGYDSIDLTLHLSKLTFFCVEMVPIFKRQELKDGKWVPTYFPPNQGESRDIPQRAANMMATLHPTVLQRVAMENTQEDNLRPRFPPRLEQDGWMDVVLTWDTVNDKPRKANPVHHWWTAWYVSGVKPAVIYIASPVTRLFSRGDGHVRI